MKSSSLLKALITVKPFRHSPNRLIMGALVICSKDKRLLRKLPSLMTSLLTTRNFLWTLQLKYRKNNVNGNIHGAPSRKAVIKSPKRRKSSEIIPFIDPNNPSSTIVRSPVSLLRILPIGILSKKVVIGALRIDWNIRSWRACEELIVLYIIVRILSKFVRPEKIPRTR
jgi:hypothetical protein